MIKHYTSLWFTYLLTYLLNSSDDCATAVQHVRAAVHQLHQRASAAVFQPSHVRPRAGGVQEGRHRLGVHRLRHGPRSLYCTH